MKEPADPSTLRILDELAHLVPGPGLDTTELEMTGTARLASAFDVDKILTAAAAAANLVFGHTRVDRDRVIATSLGRVEVDGQELPKWADLSGYYRAADDRFIQFHANFPHHRDGIVEHLGCEPTRGAVEEAVRRHDSLALEHALVEAGLVAARLRTLDEWQAHPHAAATDALPLISVERLGDAAPRELDRRRRVLDCTRVLAGPIAGQTLAANDNDVLRVGSPHLPSVPVAVMSTGFGKRNTFVDLDTSGGRGQFAELLAGADVWLDAYRPGALAGRGFDAASTAPGSVVVQISAFDWVGPWAGRRGFDSIVQSTTGIVEAGAAAAGREQPTPLPVQALDYATGFLAAFAAERLVQHQADVGGTWLARLSLLRTRNWLTSLGGPHPFEPEPASAPSSAFHTVTSPVGEVTAARPIGGSWAHGPHHLGTSEPAWLE